MSQPSDLAHLSAEAPIIDASAASLEREWFVVYTKPRQEEVAKIHLERQSFEVYLPRITVSKRKKSVINEYIEPFFPRYIFAHFDAKTENWGPIRSTTGVSGLVKFSGLPRPVPASLIQALKRNENIDNLQDVNQGSWKPGETVDIEQGPFAGYNCIFEARRSADRVSVLINIIGKQTRATLSSKDLQIKQDLHAPQLAY